MEIAFGIPQGSILGPLLFKISLANLFVIVNSMDIANYAAENMPHFTVNDIDSLIALLEEVFINLV